MAPGWITGLFALFVAAAAADSSSSSSSSSSNSGGYSGGYSGYAGPGPNMGAGQGGFYFPYQQPYQPYPPIDYNFAFQQFLASMAQQQGFYPQQFGNNFGPGGPGLDNNISPDASAAASASIGPNGGYGQASLGPDASNGLGLRIAEFGVPAPSGNGGGSFSTFSSSSSGSSDVNGKRTNFKTASVGVNDNGKVYFKTVSDP